MMVILMEKETRAHTTLMYNEKQARITPITT